MNNSISNLGDQEAFDSPFFLNNERKAKAWTSFLDANNYAYEGSYDAYHVHFRARRETKGNTIFLEGERRLNNVSTGLIPRDSIISEVLVIKVNQVFSRAELYITKATLSKKLMNRIAGRKCKEVFVSNQGKILISFSDQKFIDRFDKSSQLLDVFSEIKLDYIEINGDRVMTIRVLDMFEDESEIENCLSSVLKWKDGVLK